MNVSVHTELPADWKGKKPLRTYETRLMYIGFRRYDIERNILSDFQRDDKTGNIVYTEVQFPDLVFSRAYHTELVRVSVYSESPRVWVEEMTPDESFVFVEK